MGKKLTSAVVKIRTSLTNSAMYRALEGFPNNLCYSDKFQGEKLCKEICRCYNCMLSEATCPLPNICSFVI
jgi:hypothetical protein